MRLRHAVVESPKGSLRRPYYERILRLSIGLGLVILQEMGMSAPALPAQSLPVFDRRLLLGKGLIHRFRTHTTITKSPAGVPKRIACASYRFSTINYPSATGSIATAVNDFGAIGGVYSVAATGGQDFGFVVKPPYSANRYSTVNDLNSFDTFVYSLNNFGETAGAYYDDQGEFGFVESGNTFTSYTDPNALADPETSTELTGLNDRGFAVGAYIGASTARGFILNLKTGSYFDLAPPGPAGTYSIPSGINDLNEVVGTVVNFSTGGEVAFVYQNSTFHEFSFPNAVITNANGINNFGEIVGEYASSDGIYHGFALKNGKFTTVDDPSGSPGNNNEALGVNDWGAIVGTYESGNQEYGYLAIPK